MIEFKEASIESEDAKLLISELNKVLFAMLGHDGTAHVDNKSFELDRAGFFIGYCDGQPICCAGIHPLDEETGEVKRVYARKNNIGAGRILMAELERWALQKGYTKLALECRPGNPHAIEFYKKVGYQVRDNFPPYVGVEDAVCLEKSL